MMLLTEHVGKEPWVPKVLQAKIRYQIWINRGEENDETREKAKRELMCQPTPFPHMLCVQCTLATHKFDSRECQDAFSRKWEYNDVLKEYCPGAPAVSATVAHNSTMQRII
jgi:hypothetical protein